jgi:flagellar biosynthetic protein FlhB
MGPTLLRDWQATLRQMLGAELSADRFSPESLLHDLFVSLRLASKIALPFLLAMFAVVYAAHFWQVGWLITTKPLQPSLNKLNPAGGLKRLFGFRSAAKAAVTSIKIVIAIIVASAYVASRMVMQLSLWLVLIFLILGVADYVYQKWQWEREHRMSKQEVKEEIKQTIGDPQVKRRQRSFAMKILNQRLGKSVPTADVVVTNPEHLAIALRWDPETMNAPKVVAKGADYVALRIRQIAALHGVPILERRDLARAMYPAVDVGREIPPQFYTAVAEILAYVYRLAGRRIA